MCLPIQPAGAAAHLLFVFRLPGAVVNNPVCLCDLQPERRYTIAGLEGEFRAEMTGQELMAGALSFDHLREEEFGPAADPIDRNTSDLDHGRRSRPYTSEKIWEVWMKKFLIELAINAFGFFIAITVLAGRGIEARGENIWLNYVILALIFAVINAVLRPILSVLGCPFIILTLGLGVLADQYGLICPYWYDRHPLGVWF